MRKNVQYTKRAMIGLYDGDIVLGGGIIDKSLTIL